LPTDQGAASLIRIVEETFDLVVRICHRWVFKVLIVSFYADTDTEELEETE